MASMNIKIFDKGLSKPSNDLYSNRKLCITSSVILMIKVRWSHECIFIKPITIPEKMTFISRQVPCLFFSIDKRIKGVNQIESKPNNTALCDKLIYNSICPGLWLPQLWRMVDLSNPVAKQLGIGIETYSFMVISQDIFYIYNAINRKAVIKCFRIGLCNISG